jgi:hypothetical protein
MSMSRLSPNVPAQVRHNDARLVIKALELTRKYSAMSSISTQGANRSTTETERQPGATTICWSVRRPWHTPPSPS